MKKYYKKCRLFAVGYGIMEVITATTSMLLSLTIQFITAVATRENGRTVTDAVIASLLLAAYSLLAGFLLYYFKEGLRCRMTKAMKDDLFGSIMERSFSKFYQVNSGEYISLINNDVQQLEEKAILPVFAMIQHVFLLVMALGYIGAMNLLLAVLMLAIAIASLFLPKLYGKGVDAASEIYMKQLAKYLERIKDAFSGFEVVRNVGILHMIMEKHGQWNEKLEHKRYQCNRRLDRANNLTQTTNVLIQTMLMAVCAYLVVRDKITVSQMVLFLSMENNVFHPLFSIVENINTYQSSRPIQKKILEITSEKGGKKLPKAEPLKRKIQFRDVHFGYEDGREILKGLNIVFEKGKKYAIVGESGSGKSTILRLLLCYYTEYSGRIELDEKEISTLSAESVRCICSLIPQNIFLFHDTLYNNLTLYREVSKNQIEEVISRAGLDSVIERLDMGLETLVSENGNNFSGGEKQRIAVARALLLEKNLILMDEATANVDACTAASIERIIIEDPRLTCVSVMHHFVVENIEKYDEILVVQDGVIAEQGNYWELMEKKELFWKLQRG